MPLFPRRFGFSVAALAVCLSLPAWGIEAEIQKRTPLCRDIQERCVPIFHLNRQDKVRVQRQSDDGKWFQIRVLFNQSVGWVKSEDLKLLRPQRLDKKRVRRFSEPPLFGVEGPLPELGFQNHLEQLRADTPTQRWGSRFFPESFEPLIARRHGVDLHVLGLEKQEQALFLMRVQISPGAQYPHYEVILRLKDRAAFQGVAPLEGGGLLVAGEAEGPWGASQLLLLDAQFEPLQIIKKPEGMLRFLPAELNGALLKQRMRWLGVLPEGEVLLGAYHLGRRKEVVLRFQLRGAQWQYHSAVNWPQDLEMKLFDAHLRLKMAVNGESLYLLTRSLGKDAADRDAVDKDEPGQEKSFLSYYAGNNDALFTQAVEEEILRIFWFEEQLWSLSPGALNRWEPVFTESETVL